MNDKDKGKLQILLQNIINNCKSIEKNITDYEQAKESNLNKKFLEN